VGPIAQRGFRAAQADRGLLAFNVWSGHRGTAPDAARALFVGLVAQHAPGPRGRLVVTNRRVVWFHDGESGGGSVGYPHALIPHSMPAEDAVGDWRYAAAAVDGFTAVLALNRRCDHVLHLSFAARGPRDALLALLRDHRVEQHADVSTAVYCYRSPGGAAFAEAFRSGCAAPCCGA
jgi:hypothetical protein